MRSSTTFRAYSSLRIAESEFIVKTKYMYEKKLGTTYAVSCLDDFHSPRELASKESLRMPVQYSSHFNIYSTYSPSGSDFFFCEMLLRTPPVITVTTRTLANLRFIARKCFHIS